jgi:hypothetical protein
MIQTGFWVSTALWSLRRAFARMSLHAGKQMPLCKESHCIPALRMTPVCRRTARRCTTKLATCELRFGASGVSAERVTSALCPCASSGSRFVDQAGDRDGIRAGRSFTPQNGRRRTIKDAFVGAESWRSSLATKVVAVGKSAIALRGALSPSRSRVGSRCGAAAGTRTEAGSRLQRAKYGTAAARKRMTLRRKKPMAEIAPALTMEKRLR